MDDDRRSMTTLMVVSFLFAGAYLGYTYYMGPSQEELAAQEAQAAQAAQAARAGTDADAAGQSAEGGTGPAQHVDPAERSAQERTYDLVTDDFAAKVSNLNGGLTSMRLVRERYLDEGGVPHQMVTTDNEEFYPLSATLHGVSIPPDAVYEVEQVSPGELNLTWEGNGFRVLRNLVAGDGPYQIISTISIENLGEEERPVRVELGSYHYVSRDDESATGLLSFASRSPNISHGICAWGEEEVTRLDREKGMPPAGQPGGHGFGGNVLFAGTENSYFASVLAASGEPAARCRIRATDRGGSLDEPHGSLFEANLIYPRVTLGAGETTTVAVLAYVGPKDNDALVAAGHNLTEVVDLGWFSIVARYFVALLRYINGLAGNWGLAIILMTFMVRLLMLPLTWKSFQSMAQMRMLKPEIDKLSEMYKDDQQQKGAAMMELYRQRGVSPFGGCLPSLLQMPVWFAFYASLSTNVELYHASFVGWYTDLSAPDPYFILPLGVGVLMHFQQRLSPAATDATQAKIMMWVMPIMITSFLLFLPAGLCLYMVTNSVLGMSQQLYIQRRLTTKEEVAKAASDESAAEEAEVEAEARASAEAAATDAGPSSVLSRTRPKDKKKKSAKRRTRRDRS